MSVGNKLYVNVWLISICSAVKHYSKRCAITKEAQYCTVLVIELCIDRKMFRSWWKLLQRNYTFVSSLSLSVTDVAADKKLEILTQRNLTLRINLQSDLSIISYAYSYLLICQNNFLHNTWENQGNTLFRSCTKKLLALISFHKMC